MFAEDPAILEARDAANRAALQAKLRHALTSDTPARPRRCGPIAALRPPLGRGPASPTGTSPDPPPIHHPNMQSAARR